MFAGELAQDELEAELAAQAAHVDAGMCRLLELVAECEQRLDLRGDTTFATWLAWRCGVLPQQAREQERVAARLSELPLIHAAFARGELSYVKVAVLTRVAEPESERELLDLASVLTASQLRRAVAAFEQVTAREASEQQAREFVSWFWDEDGALALRARLAPDDGALVVRALEAAREALRARRAAEVPAGDEDAAPSECRVSNAEAMVAMADLALSRSDGDRMGGERYQVVVHVDAETLRSDAPGRCELAEGLPLAAETARRLACDGSLVELVEHEGQPLALGRKRRTVSPALRRALAARDRGCRFPGCEGKRFVEAHHVEHWIRGGETNLDNLISLCHRHHRLVHERGWSLRVGEDGEPQFSNEYGVAIPSVPRPPPPSSGNGLRDRHRNLGIDENTCRTGSGDRMDLGLVVEGIIAIKRRAHLPA
jgi:hypothetical protein